MNILGISALYHDSAAALVRDGTIIAAAQEERFTRVKHDPSFPNHAIRCCLRLGKIEPADLDLVAFYEKPWLKAERLVTTYLAMAPRGYTSFQVAGKSWLGKKTNIDGLIRRELGPGFVGRIAYSEHHQSHAASAFFPSPFAEAAVLTVDGVGEWATTTLGVGLGNRIDLFQEIRFPHSLGLLYSAFTFYAGFRVNSGEYKLMGLAPYGKPCYTDRIYEHLIRVAPDGAFHIDQDYFNYCSGLTMTSGSFHSLFDGPPRRPESPVSQKEMNIAASIQVVTEEVLLRLARTAHARTGKSRLCMAGGVALNCVANGRILREGPFEEMWIQPAAGDAGGALGAALYAWHHTLGGAREPLHCDAMRGALLGPEFSDSDIGVEMDRFGAVAQLLDDAELADAVARLLNQGKVIGWFRGRMEFGPRALGARSIIGDARRPNMQSQMNLKIKFRESFRPFAPCVLREHVGEYFDFAGDSPYMLQVAPVRESRRVPIDTAQSGHWGIDRVKVSRSDIPAVTHVDYSARIQTVDATRHGLFHTMLERFYHLTGCPVLINTSFNVRGEPIVCTPKDAYKCFMYTHIDALVLGNYLLLKERQPVMDGAAAHFADIQLD